MSTYGSSKVVSDGLIFCVDSANQRSYSGSGTIVNDLKDKKIGNLVNGVGFSNSLFVFDGTNDYIDCGSIQLISTSSPFSVEIWCDSTNPAGFPTLLSLKSNGNNWFLFYASGELRFGSPSTWYKGSYLTTNSDLQQFHQWVITYNGSGATTGSNYAMYKDGVQITISAGAVSTSDSTNTYIGRFSSSSFMHDKRIGIVKLYNRALTQTEITQNFNALRGRFGI